MKLMKKQSILCMFLAVILISTVTLGVNANELILGIGDWLAGNDILEREYDDYPIENELVPQAASACPQEYYLPGKPDVPDNYYPIRRDIEPVKSDSFLDYLDSIGVTTSGWEKVCETWVDRDDSECSIERHYWQNTGAELYYYHK